MAFSNGSAERFRGMLSPRDEAPPPSFTSYTSPFRPMLPSTTPHERASLQRRFTTNAVPTLPTLGTMTPLSPIGLQRRQAAEQTDYASAPYHAVQLIERKRKEIEALREKRRRFQLEMESFDLQTKHEEDVLQNQIMEMGVYNGHQSEPTTPPEYREAGFPSVLSRPHRYSATITSPTNEKPAYLNRSSRSSSQALPYQPSISHNPSKSVPGSRRNSDEDEDEGYDYDIPPVPTRTGAALNRISAPVTGFDFRTAAANDNDVQDFHNTAAFVLDDEEKTSLSMEHTPQKFPMLVRRSTGTQLQPDPSILTALSAHQSPDSDRQTGGWPISSGLSRHRTQHSMPLNALSNRSSVHADSYDTSQLNNPADTPTKTSAKARHSLEVTFGNQTLDSKRSSLMSSPQNGFTKGAPKLTSSFSTNDIPTLQGTNGMTTPSISQIGAPKTHAEQHLHNHNVSIGRIPPNANNRHSRDVSTDLRTDETPKNFSRPMQSVLQASATPFGPTSSAGNSGHVAPTTNSGTYANGSGVAAVNNTAYYGGYGMPMLNNAFANFNLAGQSTQWGNQMQTAMYQSQGLDLYQRAVNTYGTGRLNDSQARVIAQRRQQQNEENARYANLNLDHMRGQIYQYCKDQHGCRFLQKKLEERVADQVELIFNETKNHVVELMQDPFGNYLCQKLLEHTNDEQRTVLINNAAPEMVKIALNQHGTRALQKMIEYVTLPEQIETIIMALENKVVPLIQDLNGNHVIQKCLNHLSPEDAQFIFEAVGTNCVVVGTHRHGCCVLQRCIDHATGAQRAQLVMQITANAYALVQDPFGNYVVQYILDLGEPAFSEPLCASFCGSIGTLSRQKFSSNVIEKCIRVADTNTKRMMIEEIMNPTELQKMASDSFANYVVQTAIEYASDDAKLRLLEDIKNFLPQIKNTPHGRRFMQKIQEAETAMGVSNAGAVPNPSDHNAFTPNIPYHQRTNTQSSGGFQSPHATLGGLGGYGSPSSQIASPQPHRMSNPVNDPRFQQGFNPYGRGSGPGGLSFF